MQLLRIVKSASPEANFLVLFSVALLLAKILILNRFPSFFFGAYELGGHVEAILAGVIASYVFYLYVVHLKELRDKTTVRPYINKHSMRTVGSCENQLRDISNVSGVNLTFKNATVVEISDAFKKIAPYSKAPLIISQNDDYANWFQYFAFNQRRSKESIKRVLDQLPYLDAKLASALTAIDDCSHFHHMDFLGGIVVRNTDLSSWAPEFADYCKLCIELRDILPATH